MIRDLGLLDEQTGGLARLLTSGLYQRFADSRGSISGFGNNQG